jgi:hypothetical protein
MTTGGFPLARRDQTTEPPDAGCRGPSVDLRGRDQEGRNWSAKICGPCGAGYEEAFPDAISAAHAEDANSGAPGELDPSQAYERRMAKALAPGGRVVDRNPESLRGLQSLLTAHYRRR